MHKQMKHTQQTTCVCIGSSNSTSKNKQVWLGVSNGYDSTNSYCQGVCVCVCVCIHILTSVFLLLQDLGSLNECIDGHFTLSHDSLLLLGERERGEEEGEIK